MHAALFLHPPLWFPSLRIGSAPAPFKIKHRVPVASGVFPYEEDYGSLLPVFV